jgi:hypothetical protein
VESGFVGWACGARVPLREPQAHLQRVVMATAITVCRIHDWLEGIPPHSTPLSRFACFMKEVAEQKGAISPLKPPCGCPLSSKEIARGYTFVDDWNSRLSWRTFYSSHSLESYSNLRFDGILPCNLLNSNLKRSLGRHQGL